MSQEAKILSAIGAVTLVLVIGAAFLFGGKSSPSKEAGEKITTEQAKFLVRQDSHAIGTKNAKVMLVEFGDFQCPACGAAHPVVSQLLKEYNGKITFVFRNFPLTMHQNAKIAALAAEAAGAQGKFFEMYDALYQNQKDWGESKKPMESFEKYATAIGLDVEKFKSDVDSKKYDGKIQQDVKDGNVLGVSATPTFILNGEKISGGLPYDQFKEKIESALKNP